MEEDRPEEPIADQHLDRQLLPHPEVMEEVNQVAIHRHLNKFHRAEAATVVDLLQFVQLFHQLEDTVVDPAKVLATEHRLLQLFKSLHLQADTVLYH